MGSKQRFTYIFVLMSLTMTMLFFQNCSPSGGLYDGDSVTDDFIIDPPTIFAAKDAGCVQIATSFAVSEPVYICIQKAGIAPIYCHDLSTSPTCDRITISRNNGWTSMRTGSWTRGFSAATGGAFGAGTFTAYVIHTDDPNAVSNTTFTVNP